MSEVEARSAAPPYNEDVDYKRLDLQELHRRRDTAKKTRRPYEADWTLNLAYLANDQHVRWVPESGRLIESDRAEGVPRVTRNVMLKILRIERAKVLKNAPVPVALPSTDGLDDMITAKVATSYFRQLQDVWRFPRRMRTTVSWALGTGNGFFKWYWDAGRKAPRCTSVSPYELYFDPYARNIMDARWAIHTQFLNPDVAREMYKGHNVKFLQAAKTDNLSHPEARVFGLFNNGSLTSLEGVVTHEYWEPPTPSNKQGYFCVFTDDGIIYEGPYPYKHGRLPFTQVGHIERIGSMWFRSGMDSLRPLQDELNRAEAQIVENRNTSSGKWFIPADLELDEDPNAMPRQVMRGRSGTSRVDAKPEFFQVNAMPSWVGAEPMRIADAMSDLAGQHEVSNAGVPGRVEAASAIQLLMEMDDSVMQDIRESLNEAVADGFMMALQLLVQFGAPETDIFTYDKTGQLITGKLKKDKISVNHRVIARTTSGLPLTTAGRKDYVLQLMQAGLIADPEKALEMLDLNPEVFDLSNDQQDKKNAYYENQRLASGEPVTPHYFDSHKAHLNTHYAYMKTPEYEALPMEVQNYFAVHCQMHEFLQKQVLGEEAQKQLIAAGQMPPPTEPTPLGLPAPPMAPEAQGPADAPPGAAPQDSGNGVPLPGLPEIPGAPTNPDMPEAPQAPGAPLFQQPQS